MDHQRLCLIAKSLELSGSDREDIYLTLLEANDRDCDSRVSIADIKIIARV